MNGHLKQISDIYKITREWFGRNRFIEVHTASMAESSGFDGYVVPFTTELKSRNGTKKLHFCSSPEFEMKRILAESSKDARIYQITKAYRQEEIDEIHSPEFNMLEWYVSGGDYRDSMKDFESFFLHVLKKTGQGNRFSYNGRSIRASKNFEKIRIRDIFLEKTGIDLSKVQEGNSFQEAARSSGAGHIPDGSSWDTVFFIMFLDKVERELANIDKPVILYDYPVQIASLARNCSDELWFCERFECYIAGIELCNGYSELTDYEEHLRRFKVMNELRARLKVEAYPLPNRLMEAVKKGLPQSTGVALGMDRLCMLLTGAKNISEIVETGIYGK